MSASSNFVVGDRVCPSVNWMLVPSNEWGTVVEVEFTGSTILYTVTFDSGVQFKCFGFMLRRSEREQESAN